MSKEIEQRQKELDKLRKGFDEIKESPKAAERIDQVALENAKTNIAEGQRKGFMCWL